MSSEHLKLVGPSSGTIDTLIGQVLDGRYEIERVLGEGGMGLVYKARHVTLGKPLAIKVLKAEVSKDQEIVQRFRQEAQSATAIGNHHIIDISDFGALPDGSTFFVMEFLDGISLTKAIEPARPLKVARTLHIGKQLCRALGAAHDVGIVHRDLKPDNIYLISRGGDRDFVKVLDFGIAKVGGKQSKLTQVGQVFGTPHYMSPEQCAGTPVDRRTDIYALGVILYEMTTARVPFDADNLMGILTKHLYEEPVLPRELPPPVDAPPELEAVVMKCLAKKPDLRYQTMQEVLADLEAVEQGLTPSALADQGRRTASTGTRRDLDESPRRDTGPRAKLAQPTRQPGFTVDGGPVEVPKSKAGLAIGAVLAVALLGGGAFFALSGRGKEPSVTPEPTPHTNPTPPVGQTTETPRAPESPRAAEPTREAVEPAPDTKPPAVPQAEVAVEVQLTSEPAGAAVYREGALIGHTPFEVERPTRGEPDLELTLKLANYKDLPVRVSSYTQPRLALLLEKQLKRPLPGTAPVRPPTQQTQPQPTPQPSEPTPPPRTRTRPSTEVIDPWN